MMGKDNKQKTSSHDLLAASIILLTFFLFVGSFFYLIAETDFINSKVLCSPYCK